MLLRSQRVELEMEIAQRDQELRDERLRLARLIGRPSGAAAWRMVPWTAPLFTDTREAQWLDVAARATGDPSGHVEAFRTR
jgi:hypothetical protein